MPEFLEPELAEARDLACALWRAVHELVGSLGELAEINPDLDPDTALPYWLTNTAGAPETWQRTETN